MQNSEFTPAYLQKEARALAKGEGRFDGYTIVITSRGASLRAYFIRRGLRAFVSMAL